MVNFFPIMPSMKILHVTRTIDPTGGCEIYIRNLMDRLKKEDILSSVCTAIPPTQPITVDSINSVNELASLTHENAKISVQDFSNVCARVSPDLIHIHDLNNPYVIDHAARHFPTIKTTLNADAYCGGIDKYLYTSKKACTVPLGYSCFGIALMEKCMKRHPRRSIEIISIKKAALQALKNVGRVVVPSQASKEILIQNRVPENKIKIIPLFTNLQTTSIPAYPKGSDKILFLGRLRPYKGADFLLRALPYVKSTYELEIVGDGEDRSTLEKLSASLGIQNRVHFRGSEPHEKMKEYLKNASVLIVPSIYPDSFPTVGLEAMAMAKPVIGFRIGGIPEWLENGKTGFLVEPQNIRGLAQKIDTLLENQDLAEQMGQRGYARFQSEFNGNAHSKQIIQLYQDVVASFERSKTCV